MIEVVRTIDALREHLAPLRRAGKRLALVPTMGALHEGHLSLMREGQRRADLCAASIFVNPMQFGPNEDLARYPRDEAGDTAKCASAGVTLLFIPEPGELYPARFQSSVEVAGLTERLCGASRPGHFRGVTTVVAKLFNLFRPDLALFGEKDFQQLAVLRRMNRDLDFGIDLVGMPIVREEDGLALSSRNRYLSPEERARALSLSAGLRAAAMLRRGGERDAEPLLAAARAHLERANVVIDYLELVDPSTLEPIARADQPARMLVAAFVGKTRLIDNIAIEATEAGA